MIAARVRGFISSRGWPERAKRSALAFALFVFVALLGSDGLAQAQQPAGSPPAFEIVRTDTYKPFMGWLWFVNRKGVALGYHRGEDAPRYGPKVHQRPAAGTYWEGPEFFCDPDDMLFIVNAAGKVLAKVYLQSLTWKLDYLGSGDTMLIAQTASYRQLGHHFEIQSFARVNADGEVIKREFHLVNLAPQPLRFAMVVQDARTLFLPADTQDQVDLFALDGKGVLQSGVGSLGFWDSGVRAVGSVHRERGIASGYIVGHGVGTAGNRIGYLGAPNTDRLYLRKEGNVKYPVISIADLQARFKSFNLEAAVRVNYLYFPPVVAKPKETASWAYFQFAFIGVPTTGLGERMRGVVDRLGEIDAALIAGGVAEN